MNLQNLFVEKPNVVLPLTPPSTGGVSIRVATYANDVLGILTATSYQVAPTWTLVNAPSWVILSSNGGTCTILIDPTSTGALFQIDPYCFYVTCTDGVDTLYFPILLEVRAPFSIAVSYTNSDGTTNPAVIDAHTVNIQAYDSSVKDIIIQGIGAHGITASGCQFVPVELPAGLEFVSSDGEQLVLRVQEPSVTDPVGGLKINSEAVTVQIQAYQPDSSNLPGAQVGGFYDSPERPYILNLTIGSQSQKMGTLDVALGARYDNVNNIVVVDAATDILGGQYQVGTEIIPENALQYHWSATGLNLVSGGLTSTEATFSTQDGAATVSLQVTDSNGNQLTTRTVNLLQVSTQTSWLGTSAIKVGVPFTKVFGTTGSEVNIPLTSPDGFNTGETLTYQIGVTPTSGGTATLDNTTVTLNAAQPQSSVNLTLPSNATVGQKWIVTVSASNGSSRSGFAQVVVECSGEKSLTVPIPSVLTQAGYTVQRGVTLTSSALTATYSGVSQPASFELVGGSVFGAGVLGAPDGVYINSQGQLVVCAMTAGSYQFVIAANASGYSRSFSPVISLTVTDTPSLIINNPTSAVSNTQDNTPFTITWSTIGTPTAMYVIQSPSSAGARLVGSNLYTATQNATSVYGVFGKNLNWFEYSTPYICTSSTLGPQGSLLPSPTTAVIDENNNLTVSWTAYPVQGGYGVYAGWDITLTPTTGSAQTFLTSAANLSSTGTGTYTTTLLPGDYTMNMVALTSNSEIAIDSNPWDAPHKFPPALTSSSVSFDNDTLMIGQTVNITLNQSYTDADEWMVSYPDATSTGWLPMSTSTVAKAFNQYGTTNVTIYTQKDFSTSTPSVKLRRSYTTSIFVMNQQYNPQASAEGALVGTLGIGGTEGFEVTDASANAVTTQPYEVIVRAIARDTMTNELKLMLATSRFSNASSLLGTMAIDVFPISGRPHAKELIDPSIVLSPGNATSASPVKITTLALPSNTYVGKTMQETGMSATGGVAPYSWYATNLPLGLKMSIDGTISGTPMQLGSFDVTFAVVDSSVPAYIDEVTLTYNIPTDLQIQSTSISNATVGTQYSFQTVAQNGLPPYTWSLESGSFPIGLSIDPNTGLISGMPCTYNSTSDFAKAYAVMIQVTDAIGARASKYFTMSLLPAALGYGNLDQPVIVANDKFKMVVPVYGGQSPYTLTSLTDNGVISTGLTVVNPTSVLAVAGVVPASLTLTTANQTVYVQNYTGSISIQLSATGGAPTNVGLPAGQSYKFLVDSSANNTLPGAVCYGSLLVATPTVDGTYNVTVKVIDAIGESVSKTLTITTQQLGQGQYTVAPYIINVNGTPTTPSNWTFTSVPALPDAKVGVTYSPGAGQYYALVLMNNGVRQLTNGTSLPAIAFSAIDGVVPNGIQYTSANNQFGITTADGVVLFMGTPTLLSTQEQQTTPGFTGSFELQFSGIGSQSVSTAVRQSITVTSTGVGTTPVVVIPHQPLEIDLDINTLVSGSVNGTYAWAYPLRAEGGSGTYTFSVQGGTTLPPSIALPMVNGTPTFTSTTNQIGSWQVVVAATDSNGVSSVPFTIPVQIVQSKTQPTHIISSNLPAYLYANRAIPANTYYVEADQPCNWTATGLPDGIQLSTTSGSKVYLIGTPTTVAQNTVTLVGTSEVYGTSDSLSQAISIRAQSAKIVIPNGFSPVINQQYKVVTGSSFLSVVYTGYQPGDTNLPVLKDSFVGAVIGSPSVSGTTGNTNITADGFIMSYDYMIPGAGQDTISLVQGNTVLSSQTLFAAYPPLQAVGQSVTYTISEYLASSTLNLPISKVSGGSAPYYYTVTGLSDDRFVATNNGTTATQVQIPSVSQFTAGQSYTCTVNVTVTDAANSAPIQLVGLLTVNITLESTIVVNFTDIEWGITRATEPQTASKVLTMLMATPQNGHAPYSYDVTSLTIPSQLSGFIQKSPSNRVIAFTLNETNTSASVADYTAQNVATTPYTVTATNEASAPTVGSYTITVGLKVTDSLGITSTSTNNVNVKIS